MLGSRDSVRCRCEDIVRHVGLNEMLYVTGTGNGSPAVGVGVGVGVGSSGGTSEYVRNELRAVVGARSARPDLHPLQPPDMDNLMTFDMSAPGE